jgi:Tol biopolymer transport system component
MSSRILNIITVVAVWATTAAVGAESASVLLQKGIYTEETEGNLDAAIRIYQQITAEAATNRSVAMQAQYRLGVCYQKKGDKAQAISILNDLLKQFPAEAALGQKARELLAALGQIPSSNIAIRQLPLTLGEVHCVSSDGRLAAYRPKGTNTLAIYELPTGKTWTATRVNEGKVVESAHISPDGHQIAFQTGSHVVRLAKTDGSDAKEVYKIDQGEIWIQDWLPDGSQLIVAFWGEDAMTNTLSLLDIKTGTMKEIKRGPPKTLPVSSRLSSNGRYLACRVGWRPEEQRKLSLLDLASADEVTLLEGEIGDLMGWSPDDAKILFLSKRSGAPGLWAIPVREGKRSGEPELVKANVGDISPLGLTRDGSLYYTETKSFKNIYIATADFRTGEILGQPRRVSDRFLGEQSMPVWSKDGQKLMFAVQLWGRGRFVSASMATGEQKDYPVGETFTTWLQQYAWSQDGAFLLATAGRVGLGHGIHRYELATGTTETLVKTDNMQLPGHWVCHPRLSPDGNSFYYARRDFFKRADGKEDWKDRITRRHLRSDSEEVVFESPEKLNIWWPYELSPDGQRLAIVASEEFVANNFVVALKVRSVSGGPETKEVLRLAPRDNVNSLAWTPDGKRLVYTKGSGSRDQGAGEASGLWSIAVDSGQPVELKIAEPDIRDIALHPDGRQIAFRAGLSSVQSAWVMEGLMPKAAAPTTGPANP